MSPRAVTDNTNSSDLTIKCGRVYQVAIQLRKVLFFCFTENLAGADIVLAAEAVASIMQQLFNEATPRICEHQLKTTASMEDEKRPLLKPTYTDLSDTTISVVGNFNREAAKSKALLDKWTTAAAYPWKWLIKKTCMRQCLAEFFGTFLLVAIGNGAIAQTLLSNPVDKFGTFRSINIGYGLGLMIAVYVSIGVSGGHLNPAVSLAMALRGKMTWLMLIPYWIAQFLGAFFSSPFVHGIYIDAINRAGGLNASTTAGVFATYPAPYLTLGNGFLDQVFGTFILLIGIFAVTDSKNSEVLSGLKPFIIGLLLWAVGSSFGMNAGYAINPARDFGPRLYTAIVGWGPQVFICDFCGVIRHWWWVPLIAPMFGGALAAFFYWFFIDAHYPDEATAPALINDNSDDEEKKVEKI